MKQNSILKSTLVFLFLLIFFRQGFAIESLAPLVKRIQPAVVTVITFNESGERLAIGSGFFINKEGLLITNYHVIENAHRMVVETPDRNKYEVSAIVGDDKNGDLVCLAVNIRSDRIRHLRITGIIPDVGDRVMVVGSPLGLEQTISDGVVSAVRAITDFGEILQISAPISRGSSGGPVVNRKGEVVGVATFQIVGGQNLNFAIPGYRVLSLKHRAENLLTKIEEDLRVDADKPIETQKEKSYADEFRDRLYKNNYRKGLTALEQAESAYAKKRYKVAEYNYQEAISFFRIAASLRPYGLAGFQLKKAESRLKDIKKLSPKMGK